MLTMPEARLRSPPGTRIFAREALIRRAAVTFQI
jgi:hypothetical protein